METITVIDSVMGSGKTSWTIKELLNKNLDENILYITPYLNEVKRIKTQPAERLLSRSIKAAAN